MRAEAVDNADGAWRATIAAAILRRASMVHVVSVALTLAALLGGVAAAMVGVGPQARWLAIGGAVLLAGMVEFWLAVRVILDAELFEAIARDGGDLVAFDRAMHDLGLKRMEATPRALAERISATFRLLKFQCAALGLQFALLVAAATSA